MGEVEGRRLRKRIKPPQNSDEYFEGVTPDSQERNHPHAREVSDPEPEFTPTRAPRAKPTKKKVHRGPLIEFNPNLPPAPFPTDHHPQYNGLVNDDQHDLANLMTNTQCSNASQAAFVHNKPTALSQSQGPNTVNTRASVSDGIQQSVFGQNMRRMEHLGRLSHVDQIAREMDTSDEDDVTRSAKKVGHYTPRRE